MRIGKVIENTRRRNNKIPHDAAMERHGDGFVYMFPIKSEGKECLAVFGFVGHVVSPLFAMRCYCERQRQDTIGWFFD